VAVEYFDTSNYLCPPHDLITIIYRVIDFIYSRMSLLCATNCIRYWCMVEYYFVKCLFSKTWIYPKDECLYEEGLYHITIYGRLLIMAPKELHVKAEILGLKIGW